MLPVGDVGVDLALHKVEFAIDLGQAFLGFDQDQPIHAVGDVFGNHWRRAVVHVKARHQRFPGHRFFRAGLHLQHRRAAARAGRGVKVDRMHHRAVAGILQMNVDGVADAHADERPRHFAVEGPVAKRGRFSEAAFHLRRQKIDAHRLRVALCQRRRQIDGFA